MLESEEDEVQTYTRQEPASPYARIKIHEGLKKVSKDLGIQQAQPWWWGYQDPPETLPQKINRINWKLNEDLRDNVGLISGDEAFQKWLKGDDVGAYEQNFQRYFA